MEPAWAFVVLLVYPALQVPLLWLVVRRLGLRNDDGPGDPVGYSLSDQADDGTSSDEWKWGKGDVDEWDAGRCSRCGVRNDPIADYCTNCLSGL